MPKEDKTQELLRNLLDGVYREQGLQRPETGDSYLTAQDGQYLGKITTNNFDNASILNQFGPYGSPYSSTSIFNKYSKYGGQYGQFSPDNPYSTTPPELFIQGGFLGYVSRNQYVSPLIPADAFYFSLQNHLPALLSGNVLRSEIEVLQMQGVSFIAAEDGTFLGKLTPNPFDKDSIFNKYGPYGSQFSQTCIFNPYSPYGGLYSKLSPFNQFAARPPRIYLKGEFKAYLTVNPSLQPSIDPNTILDWATQNISRYG